MSKNFTVEWLSQSSHAQQMENSHKPSVPGSVSNSCAERCHLVMKGDCNHEKEVPSSPGIDSRGYTSASESDVGDDSEGESGQLRRVRTKFTSEQISRLEKTFNKHKYLGASQRRKIADKLHLSETQVKTWFQNRRMKMKREDQDMRTAQYFMPTLLAPVTSFQHHGMSGQRPHLMCIHPHVQRMPIHPMMFSPGYC